MTHCGACGHNSFTDDVCEGCRRPFPSTALPPGGAQQTVQMQPLRRVSLTGEVFEGGQPVDNSQQQTLQMMPQLPSQTVRRVALTGAVEETTQPIPARQSPGMPPEPSTAYSGPQSPPSLRPPVRGETDLPAAAYYAASMGQLAASGSQFSLERWEKALAIALPIFALSMALVHFAPMAMFAVVFANLFFIPVVLGATGAIPRYEDAILDCAIMLGVAILCGPLIALGVYLVFSLARQEGNSAIITLLAVNILIRGVFGVAFAPAIDTIALAAMWGFLNMLGFFGVCLSFLGWLLSSFFRPLNA